MKTDSLMRRSSAAGFSLIELMIALLIGTILLLGLVQIFSASRSAYLLSQGIARNQESSRFAVDFLTRDLRMAGHAGCVNDQSLLTETDGSVSGGNIRSLFLAEDDRNANNVAAAPFPLRFDVSIQGFEANGTGPGNTSPIPALRVVGAANAWTPALPTELQGLGALAGTDILVLRYLSAEESPITAFNAAGTPSITYPAAGGGLATGGSGFYAIADCRSATVFQASAVPTATAMDVTPTGLNASSLAFVSTQDGSLAYKPGGASLFRAESVAYYIAMNTAVVPEPALYRARWITAPGGAAPPNRVPEEMVEGIESMQLLYGLDAQTDLNLPPAGYVASMQPASAIGGLAAAATWRRVGAVQVGLLVRNTGERAASAAAAVDPSVLQVQMPVPADTNYRTSYETTVALRNRLFGE